MFKYRIQAPLQLCNDSSCGFPTLIVAIASSVRYFKHCFMSFTSYAYRDIIKKNKSGKEVLEIIGASGKCMCRTINLVC